MSETYFSLMKTITLREKNFYLGFYLKVNNDFFVQ